MLEFAIAFSLAFGPADAGWTLDIHPNIVFEIADPVKVPFVAYARCGVALPHVGFAKVTGGCSEDVGQHEMGHLDQYGALGPGLILLQAFSRGEAVEDYVGPEGSTWFPSEAEKNQCPAVRLTSTNGVQFMPCWNPF